jgi:hypothetical protein
MKKAKTLQIDSKANILDTDGDGIITDEELDQAEAVLRFEQEKVRFENEDKKQDAQRNMAWFALGGMLLYPFAVVIAVLVGLDKAADVLGDMAPTYFVAVAAIVAAFYAKEALNKSDN